LPKNKKKWNSPGKVWVLACCALPAFWISLFGCFYWITHFLSLHHLHLSD
jgi:hypothetical protein